MCFLLKSYAAGAESASGNTGLEWHGHLEYRTLPLEAAGMQREKGTFGFLFPIPFDPGTRFWYHPAPRHHRCPRLGLVALQGLGGEEAEVGNNTEGKTPF